MAQAVLLQLQAIDRAKGLYIFAEPVTEVCASVPIIIYIVIQLNNLALFILAVVGSVSHLLRHHPSAAGPGHHVSESSQVSYTHNLPM